VLVPNFVAGRPFPAEHDLAGIVVASKSPLHAPGARVFGIIPVDVQFATKQGALSQYARLPGANLAARAPGLSATDAAGIALAGETAYQGLFDVCGLEAGQAVFINGGSTSVGAFAIQFAKARGITVWASASGKNEEYVRGLGADHVSCAVLSAGHSVLTSSRTVRRLHKAAPADRARRRRVRAALPRDSRRRRARRPRAVRRVPGVHDAGRGVRARRPDADGLAWRRARGRAVRVARAPAAARARRHPACDEDHRDAALARAAAGHCAARGGRCAAAAISLSSHHAADKPPAPGKVRPVVDSVFAFEDTLKAYERIMTGRAKGKVVVRVDPDAE
jgi:hypothetical protein